MPVKQRYSGQHRRTPRKLRKHPATLTGNAGTITPKLSRIASLDITHGKRSHPVKSRYHNTLRSMTKTLTPKQRVLLEAIAEAPSPLQPRAICDQILSQSQQSWGINEVHDRLRSLTTKGLISYQVLSEMAIFGRQRRQYQITEAGRAKLKQGDDSKGTGAIPAAHHLSSAHISNTQQH